MTMKLTMKKFHLVSKYANYPTWDEKQNIPFKLYEKNKCLYERLQRNIKDKKI